MTAPRLLPGNWIVLANPDATPPARWMVVDGDCPEPTRRVVAQCDDEDRARVIADLLTRHDDDYRRKLETIHADEPF